MYGKKLKVLIVRELNCRGMLFSVPPGRTDTGLWLKNLSKVQGWLVRSDIICQWQSWIKNASPGHCKGSAEHGGGHGYGISEIFDHALFFLKNLLLLLQCSVTRDIRLVPTIVVSLLTIKVTWCVCKADSILMLIYVYHYNITTPLNYFLSEFEEFLSTILAKRGAFVPHITRGQATGTELPRRGNWVEDLS